jgi:hypothetical protein
VFDRIEYSSLNSRQKENYNFQKVAGLLADYGFNCLRLSDDWQGADFIACHISGETFLKVQLKGRLTLDQKYEGKDIHIAFFDGADCYLYPHDQVLARIEAAEKINGSRSWNEGRAYSWPSIPAWIKAIIAEYKV